MIKNKKMKTKSLSRKMKQRSIFHHGKKIFLIIIFLIFNVIAFTQPLPGGDPSGSGADPLGGGGAPIGGGLFILLGLGAAYGGFKGYKFYQKKKESLLD